jgi:hypothetical protein
VVSKQSNKLRYIVSKEKVSALLLQLATESKKCFYAIIVSAIVRFLQNHPSAELFPREIHGLTRQIYGLVYGPAFPIGTGGLGNNRTRGARYGGRRRGNAAASNSIERGQMGGERTTEQSRPYYVGGCMYERERLAEFWCIVISKRWSQ